MARVSSLVVVLVVAVAGCGGGGGSKPQTGAKPSSAAPARTVPGAPDATAVPPAVKKAATERSRKLAPAIVATVAGQPITLAQYRAAHSAALAGFPGGAPQPPRYERCVAATRQQFAAFARRAPKGAKTPKAPRTAQLRKQCAQRAAGARTSAMTQLIQARWTTLEAKARHVTVSPKEVEAAIARQRKLLKTTGQAWSQYLKRSGLTEARLRAQIRRSLLNQKLAAARSGTAPKVSDAEVERYFAQNRARFGVPERRDLDIIVTRARSDAEQARQALRGGMAWRTAASKWSIDPATKASGGRFDGVTRAALPGPLGSASFSAPRGKLIGPLASSKRWYLARVRKVVKGSAAQIAPYKQRIRLLLEQQAQSQRAAAANAAYTRRWRARTVCRPGYVVALCANAPRG